MWQWILVTQCKNTSIKRENAFLTYRQHHNYLLTSQLTAKIWEQIQLKNYIYSPYSPKLILKLENVVIAMHCNLRQWGRPTPCQSLSGVTWSLCVLNLIEIETIPGRVIGNLANFCTHYVMLCHPDLDLCGTSAVAWANSVPNDQSSAELSMSYYTFFVCFRGCSKTGIGVLKNAQSDPHQIWPWHSQVIGGHQVKKWWRILRRF